MEDPTRGIADFKPFVRRLNVGDVLFQEGDVDQRVFVLLDGRVQVIKDGVPVAEIGVADSFIGEVSALTKKPRWASAQAVEASTVMVIEDVEEMFRGGGDWGMRLARILAERLDRTNERLKRLQVLLEETRSRDSEEAISETMRIVVGDVSGQP